MNNDIISLQETSENTWKAKYQGNYGIYTIKIKIYKGKTETFSCSCPSDYYPCKHIAMIKEAIDSQMGKNKKAPKEDTLSIEELLQKVPHKELVNFIAVQAKYDPELTNKLFVEFLHMTTGKKEDNYAMVLRKALETIDYDFNDLYEYQEDSIEIDILDELFAKASQFISQNRFDEAIAICKACIEQFALWVEELDEELFDFVDPNYTDKPFELLSQIASKPGVNADDLFQYCKSEMDQPKYSNLNVDGNFHGLLVELALTDDNIRELIALQDSLLQNIQNKSSNEAKEILERKITIYQKNNQPETAWQLVKENLQIESFRKQVVQQKIKEGKFAEAKALISDFLFTHPNDQFHSHAGWQELALSIAQEEHDIPVIRKIAFSFIENHFNTDYYRIYKSSFQPKEWKLEVQKVIAHYEKTDRGFNNSVANVLAEEQDASMLIKYIEKHLSVDRLEQYHSHFSTAYPKETLDLFGKTMNQYADKNTGRNHYEYMVRIFKKMARIKGGKEMANMMIAQIKSQYKNRRAMVEIFNNVHL